MLLEIKGFLFVKNFLEVAEAIVFVKKWVMMLVYTMVIQTLRNTVCCRIFQMQVLHECFTSSWS